VPALPVFTTMPAAAKPATFRKFLRLSFILLKIYDYSEI
jgi:hypothetical protein